MKLSKSDIKKLIKNEQEFLKKNKTLDKQSIEKRNTTFLATMKKYLSNAVYFLVMLQVFYVIYNLMNSTPDISTSGLQFVFVSIYVVVFIVLPLIFLRILLAVITKIEKLMSKSNGSVSKDAIIKQMSKKNEEKLMKLMKTKKRISKK
jgi:hypothetical protein